jgi:hypothetical protein
MLATASAVAEIGFEFEERHLLKNLLWRLLSIGNEETQAGSVLLLLVL